VIYDSISRNDDINDLNTSYTNGDYDIVKRDDHIDDEPRLDNHISQHLDSHVMYSDDDIVSSNDGIRRSTRVRNKPNILTMDKGGVWTDKNLSIIEDYVMSSITTEQYTPKSYTDAINCPDKDSWIASMDTEYNTLHAMNTFSIVDRPPNANVLPCKWVYKVKEGNNDVPFIFKSRLVPLGCNEIKE
jgi:hypothetical protein